MEEVKMKGCVGEDVTFQPKSPKLSSATEVLMAEDSAGLKRRGSTT
jgi:hypothetical protein